MIAHSVASRPIWLGATKSPHACRRALREAGCIVGDWADDLLNNCVFMERGTEKEIGLAIVTVAELGLRVGASYQDVRSHALEMGLNLCPAEVGPVLRLAYCDQPREEWLVIAMEAISGSDSKLDTSKNLWANQE